MSKSLPLFLRTSAAITAVGITPAEECPVPEQSSQSSISPIVYIINVGMVLPGASAPASIFHSLEGLPDSGMRTKVTLFGCACTLAVTIPLFTLFSLVLG
ncbi:hypothetical protein [Anaerotruncus colihominis]|uniref:hypothetical protein n=1 Tax=Anaerotruncus colihominis TaxID=169435 RepID=UPI001FA87435|nr:hypothetical protein [Anaerotruncus colihominis]